MATTIADLNKVELKNRTLWFDGDSTVAEPEIVRLLSAGLPVEGLFVGSISKSIQQYNSLVPPDQQIRVKSQVGDLTYDWNIPEKYKNLDLVEFLKNTLVERATNLSDSDWDLRAMRVAQELSLYYKLGLEHILRALIYIINTLRTNNIVWGVGRGSSVSSYVLYLIGVHDVDSVKYELDIADFLRTE